MMLRTFSCAYERLMARTSQSASAIQALPQSESAEERLVRQVESNRALADRLREEYQKARMAEAVEAGQVEVVDLATLPYKPVPRLRTLRLLGLEQDRLTYLSAGRYKKLTDIGGRVIHEILA